MTKKINDSHRGRSEAFSAAMRRSAERRCCPACARRSAMRRVSDGLFSWRECRWCDWHSQPRQLGS